ncbi:MAG: ketoacyl-ACP synthase III [Candidatus Omnitrophica bacterium]|nr:ketoacyl-ACP synthase III [Candidatus Omnitrophota bacterium]
MSEIYSGIRGLGAYLPEKVLTNFDLEKMVDTTNDWIFSRTGIQERRIAEKGQSASALGIKAAMEALEDAEMAPSELNLIIVATVTPDMLFPSTACAIQNQLGAKCGAFDLAAACSGFTYALTVADGLIRSGLYQNILVVGTEVLSSFIDWKDRSTCVLFGDGAGAAVISRNFTHGKIIASSLGSDGSQGDILKIPAGGSAMPPSPETIQNGLHFLKMQGADVFKVAVRTMEDVLRELVQRSALKISDINLLIPHQANRRILQAVAERLELPEEKVYINVHRYGNISSASTVVALYEAQKEGRIKSGDLIAIVAFGGGLTWGATLIRW